jgi:hypothetical protein
MLADYCHEIIPARDRELLILGVWLVVVDLIHPDRHITLMLVPKIWILEEKTLQERTVCLRTAGLI